MNKSVYMPDHAIIPRIQKYLGGLQDLSSIDISMMSDELQKQYPREYGRRKRNAFRALVKKTYDQLMIAYGNNILERNSDLSDDEQPSDTSFQHNSLNNQLMAMYGRNSFLAPKPIGENELIDISSDDSDDDQPTCKKSNGGSQMNELGKDIIIDTQKLPNVSVTLAPTTSRKRKLLPTDNSGKLANAFKASHKRSFYGGRKKYITNDLEEPKVSFSDIGGLDNVLVNLCQMLVHMKHPEIYRQIGISPPRGFLLHGPPGCGKTLLANCIAGELDIPLLKVAAPELVAGLSGESEERIRELFERATVSAPCILFIDEIDAITPNRQFAQKDMERRIVAQLLTCLDDLSKDEDGDQVLVIGATNRPDALDPALRRAGRFDREISLGIPDTKARLNILRVLTAQLSLEDNFDYDALAKYTPGYVGADLMSLTREAAIVAVNRVFNELKEKKRLAAALQKAAPKEPKPNLQNSQEAEIVVDADEEKKSEEGEDASSGVVVVVDGEGGEKPEQIHKLESTTSGETLTRQNNSEAADVQKVKTPLEEIIFWLHNDAPLTTTQLNDLFITGEDFAKALKFVQPSAKREGFATVPDVTWDDIGSLRDIREELQLTIIAPVRHAEHFDSLGLTTPTGVLLCGPPGCGKTLLAKAIANEAGINFISVKGPELLNMYVGESERGVRLCFERAKNSAPCVIFFDELDALCPKRSDSREGGSTMRVVNQMLTEMDGVQDRNGVYLLAASNRPDIIDPAVLRPGRLDKILYVGLPTAQDRVDILRTITKNGTKPLLAPDVDLDLIGNSPECDGYTGADLAALVREAGVRAFREIILQGEIGSGKPAVVTTEHFKHAVGKIRPSVSEKDRHHYAKLKKAYSARQPDVEEMELS